MKRRKHLTVGTGIGAALLIAAAVGYGEARMFVARSEHAPGRVLERECHVTQDDDEVCRPVAGFLTPDGIPHRFAFGVATNLQLVEVGEVVEVLYDPNDPQRAREGGFPGMWWIALLLFAGGWIALGRWWAGLLDLSVRGPTTGTAPIQRAAAVAGALLVAAAWWRAGSGAPGLLGAVALVGAAVIGGMLTWHAAGWTRRFPWGAAGYSLFAAGAASLVGAFAFVPADWISGWLVAVPLVLLLALPLHLALWGWIARAVVKVTSARRLRDDARRAVRGGTRVPTLLVRFRKRDGETAILGRRDDRGEADVLAAASVLPAGTEKGTWLLLYEPIWGRRAGTAELGYREATWEESIEGVGRAVALGLSVEGILEGRPASLAPFLGLAGAAAAVTLAAFVGATWVLSPPLPPRREPPTPLPESVTLEGTARQPWAGGTSPSQTSCRVTVAPVRRSLFNCRVRVACGAQTIYGDEPDGLAVCVVDHGRLVSARGGTGSSEDPSVRLDLLSGMVWVGPRSDQGQWRAVVATDPRSDD